MKDMINECVICMRSSIARNYILCICSCGKSRSAGCANSVITIMLLCERIHKNCLSLTSHSVPPSAEVATPVVGTVVVTAPVVGTVVIAAVVRAPAIAVAPTIVSVVSSVAVAPVPGSVVIVAATAVTPVGTTSAIEEPIVVPTAVPIVVGQVTVVQVAAVGRQGVGVQLGGRRRRSLGLGGRRRRKALDGQGAER